MRISTTAVLLPLVLFLLSGCGTTARFAGDAQITSTSGSTNTTNTPQVLSVDGGAYGVAAVEWAEGGTRGGLDKPCYLNVEFRSLTDALRSSGNNTVSRNLNVCNNQHYNQGSLLRIAGAASAIDPRLPVFVDGIESCDSESNGNERIKGIRLMHAMVNDADPDPAQFMCTIGTNTTIIESAPCDEYYPDPADAAARVKTNSRTRTNCGEWNGPVTCQEGKIASGVRAFTSTAGEIIGLGLVCDTVAYERDE